MKTMFLVLNWLFGILFTFLFIGMVFQNILSGICLLAIGLLLLPPVRSFVYNQIGYSLTFLARSILFVILFIAAAMFFTPPPETQETQVAKLQEPQAPAELKQEIEAKQNEPVAVPDIKTEPLVENNQQVAEPKPEIITPKAPEKKVPSEQDIKLEISQILASLKKIPAKKFEENLSLYKQLGKLDPKNGKYKDKIVYYQNQLKYKTSIDESALLAYTVANGFKNTVSKHKSRLKAIEKFRLKAAQLALDSHKCSYVTMSELSDSRGSKNNLQFWVDCKNNQRFYFSENDLKLGNKAISEEEKSWDKGDALIACRELIFANAKFPSSVDIHSFLGTSTYKAPITFNVVVSIDFDAKNSFGMNLPHTAKCYFKPGYTGTIELYNR